MSALTRLAFARVPTRGKVGGKRRGLTRQACPVPARRGRSRSGGVGTTRATPALSVGWLLPELAAGACRILIRRERSAPPFSVRRRGGGVSVPAFASATDGQHGEREVLSHHGSPEHEPPEVRPRNERAAEGTIDRVGANRDAARWAGDLWHGDPQHRFTQGGENHLRWPIQSRAKVGHRPGGALRRAPRGASGGKTHGCAAKRSCVNFGASARPRP